MTKPQCIDQSEKILTDLNIDPAARAENLSIEEYCLITNHLEII